MVWMIPAFVGAGAELTSNKQNIAFAEAEALQATHKAKIEEGVYRANAARDLARQEAVSAASGVDISSGTPMDILLESAYNMERNAQLIKYGGQIATANAKAQADAYRRRTPWIYAKGVSNLITSGMSAYGGAMGSSSGGYKSSSSGGGSSLPSWWST